MKIDDPMLPIGAVAKRVGSTVSAVRFYADKGLIPSVRTASGHRWFARSTIRRVSFILICQRLGYSLEAIQIALSSLPNERTPTKRDWQKMSKIFTKDLDQRIEELQRLKEKLTGCIGCGCLSLSKCHLYNPADAAAVGNTGGDLNFKSVKAQK